MLMVMLQWGDAHWFFYELAKSTYASQIDNLFNGYGVEVAIDTTNPMKSVATKRKCRDEMKANRC